MTAPNTQNDTKEPVIALFNYGGGLRGLIPAHIMTRIEKKTGHRMSEMVDIFCGPSTGAILNAAMTLPHPDHPDRCKYHARHLVRFYEREAQNIFPRDRFRELRGLLHDFNNRMTKFSQLESVFKHGHYNPNNLGTALKALYGDARLSDSLKSLVIPFYSINGANTPDGFYTANPTNGMRHYAQEGGHAVWLRNMRLNNGQHRLNNTPNVSLYDAVMASCAAPTYFPCHHFPIEWNDERGVKEYAGIDGNIFDNPGVSYYGSLRKQLDPHQKLVMIGLGTGHANRSITKDKWNKYGSLGVVDPVNDLPLINIFFHASESALSHSFVTELGDDLYMFNKTILDRSPDTPNIEIDDGSPENLRKLRDFAESIMEENESQLDHVCDILVRNCDRKKQPPQTETKKENWVRRLFTLGKKD
ncbi:MAG: phospholipase [Alphaproteobacteria bacterium]|nr:phospholipase [Alphaproteobacteria bacterium]NCQ87706.1 phospholipase [Alphaproteobacteria bacterium]NCT05785.1 phospholipase [Alphaproteobacteria bacterium]